MNRLIRADTSNQMLLRTEMQPCDIQVIRDAAANFDSLPARLLNKRFEREAIYMTVYQSLLERRSAAAAGAHSDTSFPPRSSTL
ncbi:hypothetical protein K438DRAFT_1798218 [Mycena galopus ATCC 62051]|nr:hypothetical protein K438DRAFT_1798218 [Mycena galopus ATCC 62051]